MINQYREYGYLNDGPVFAHSYILDNLLELLNTNQNKKILDIGCGNGYIASELLKKGYDVYGIDASKEGISIIKKKYYSRFFVLDLTYSKLPAELVNVQFDTIISTEVIEHLYDPKAYIEFCKECLRNNGGGELIISTPYHGYFKNLIFSIINAWDRHFTVLWDGGHIKFWSRKTLTLLLEAHGFKVTRFLGSGRLPYLWKTMLIKAVIKN